MTSEETPLLAEQEALKNLVYSRFSPAQKRVILAIVSWTGLIPLFVSGSFVPSIPQIAKDLNTTGSVISLSISLQLLVIAFASLSWATYSTYYGRRPIYLTAMPVFIIGTAGTAMAYNVPSLLIFRMIQALGSSCGLSVGSGAIADIYQLEERGTAMGIFFAAVLLGPALAPVAGGLAAHYYTWRHMQYALFIAGVLSLVLCIFYLPETSHPGARGVDTAQDEEERSTGRRTWRWVWLNPLTGFLLMRSPNLLAVTLAGTFVLLSDYVLLIPLAYTIGERYNIKNPALIGAFFIPAGVGNTIGAPLAGRISDYMVVKWRARRGGEWVPEDRLRTTIIGGGFFVPLSMLFSGIFIRYVPGTLGIVLNLICLFFNGLGVDFVLSPSAAYFVDVLHSRSAEVTAASSGLRGIIMALITALILPSIDTLGVLVTDTMSAISAWVGFALILATIRYGDRMRAWVDVGFSNIRNT